MGKLRGFLEYERKEETTEAVELRVKNYKEFTKELDTEELNHQGARCMDCGIPFCHSGCPLGNLIPDFNHAVYQNDWKKALQILHSTNNLSCKESDLVCLEEPPLNGVLLVLK